MRMTLREEQDRLFLRSISFLSCIKALELKRYVLELAARQRSKLIVVFDQFYRQLYLGLELEPLKRCKLLTIGKA